jgi:hypothetical protein
MGARFNSDLTCPAISGRAPIARSSQSSPSSWANEERAFGYVISSAGLRGDSIGGSKANGGRMCRRRLAGFQAQDDA